MVRQAASVWAGKAVSALSRLSGRGAGATFPGDVARALDPGVLRKLSRDLRAGAVLITGTNGKTTTARLVSALLEGLPARVVANRTGANLIWGLTTAALRGAGWNGRLKADWAVFEVDEATLPRAIDEVRPRAVLVMNLFRDQLDRYGELETTARTIAQALETLPPGARAVLNADDPRVGEIGLGLSRPPLWYGLEDPSAGDRELPHAADAITCPRCGSRLRFTSVYVGHDGVYSCPNGDFARPRPEVVATEIRLEGLDRIRLRAGGQELEARFGGLYNAYNLLAAFALGQALGLKPAYMAERLRTVAAAFGRQERFERDGRSLTLLLAKNPTGFNEVLKESLELAGARHFLIGLNDRLADGEDVSWIWDVDFERLAGRAATVQPAGVRAADLAVRLKYAEVAALPPVADGGAALDALLRNVPAGEDVYLLCTYTAMLALRAELVRRGWLKPYWTE